MGYLALALASDELWDQVSYQEAFDIVVQACVANKKFGSPNRMRKAFSDQYGTICTSP
ncbi:unnamed protein product [Rhodiola kirilowii]